MPTVLEVASESSTKGVEGIDRVYRASSILGVEATLLPKQTMSSSSNEGILTNPLSILMVLEPTEGYIVEVEVADRILEVLAVSGVFSPLFLGQTLPVLKLSCPSLC